VSRIYLDNNATTAILPEVLEAMKPFLSGAYGNASSLHREGRHARRAVESAREQIAECIDAAPRQVIFTSGGTEANNLAVLGLAGSDPAYLVTTPVEHPSVYACFDFLRTRGFQVDRVRVNRSGVVDAERLYAHLERQPRMVSVMLANNETGTIQPISELAAAARKRGVLFHSDAVQAVGKMAVSFRSLGVTSLSFSGHKFHGPTGVGALVIDSRERLQPLLLGGHQEFGLRAGTEPVAQIVGLATALQMAVKDLPASVRKIRHLADCLVQGLREFTAPVIINGADDRLCSTVNVLFPDVDAAAAVVALDLEGLACSTGSACSSGAPTPSATLLAMGLDEQQVRSCVRFSLCRFTTEAEVARAVRIIARVVHRLRATPKRDSLRGPVLDPRNPTAMLYR
jgi:cysteine desulfurase